MVIIKDRTLSNFKKNYKKKIYKPIKKNNKRFKRRRRIYLKVLDLYFTKCYSYYDIKYRFDGLKFFLIDEKRLESHFSLLIFTLEIIFNHKHYID